MDLRAHEGTALGIVVQLTTPQLIETLGTLVPDGLAFVMIDGQHEGLDPRTTPDLFRAGDLHGLACLVRVAVDDVARAALYLDQGAAGIVFPCVNTPEQARRAVETCRYPPVGRRSLGGSRRLLARGGTDADPLCIIQIEHMDGVENAEEIFAVDGIDAWFPGPADMAKSIGAWTGSIVTARSAVAPHFDRVQAIAEGHGVGRLEYCGTPEQVAAARSSDVPLALVGQDYQLLPEIVRAKIGAGR